MALKSLLPDVSDISAVEINASAAEKCKELVNPKNIYVQSLVDFAPTYQRDFVLVKAILIHMHPDILPDIYRKIYETSKKYICICEYYNPTPTEITYRGNKGILFKRDFCGEMMDMYPDLKLIDYGFVYHRDSIFPQDDINWFLLSR